ncbi:isochorismate synthase [Nonomuraea sp. NN258]|uniref:isochorismate synthase n=1 Tax=Nonomuraea antri TaxID=2730852 RepID=UPI001567E193|nr:isochorismate synthase [Nonomuraea antri]NRQ31994.1 isochorismate synthase [Nonomuraea antri]
MTIDEFFLASPRGTLLAGDIYFAVPPSARANGLADLPARVHGVLGVALAAGHDAPIVVGAIPFAPDAHAHLFVPQWVRHEPPLAGREHQPGPTLDPDDSEQIPPPHDYAEAVRQAVDRLRAGDLDKVVLARSLTVPFEGDLAPLVAALAERDPTGYTFAAALPGGRTLLGASPELLVSRFGPTVVANPLAGSVPADGDPTALLSSAKDLHEHALVVDAVAAALQPYCVKLDVPERPSLVRTAAMWHLSTRITGELADPETSSLALACALHPTPAVCGTPTEAARRLIAELEPFDRGFYTGLVGWQDAKGDGEWVVAIRCAVADGSALTLYAGAGIVADSDPDAELAETSAKFRTALGVLHVAR